MNKLNPGYKFLTLLLASAMLSVTYNPLLNISVFIAAATATALTPGVNKKRMLLGFQPFLLTAAGLFMSGLLFPPEAAGELAVRAFDQGILYAASLDGALLLSSRMLAFGGIGLVFALTTNSMDFVMSLMQQFRLPPKFAYGILAAWHFFPIVQSEYETVRQALLVRGIKTGPFSRKRMFPMLVHAIERSESIAMAMESRGFDDGAPRRVAFEIPLRAADFVFLFSVTAGLLAAILALH